MSVSPGADLVPPGGQGILRGLFFICSAPRSQNALHSETVAVRGAARLSRPGKGRSHVQRFKSRPQLLPFPRCWTITKNLPQPYCTETDSLSQPTNPNGFFPLSGHFVKPEECYIRNSMRTMNTTMRMGSSTGASRVKRLKKMMTTSTRIARRIRAGTTQPL